MKVRFLKGRHRGRAVDVNPEGFVIGRDDNCDLQLSEDGISRRHCRIYRQGEEWRVEDLGSTNGVRVNGNLIEQATPIRAGDRVGLYNQAFLFTDARDIVAVDQYDKPQAEDTARVSAAAAQATEEEITSAAAPPPGFPTNPVLNTPPKEGFPWTRALILVVIIGLLGWLVHQTFLSQEARNGTAQSTVETPEEKQAVTGTGADAKTGATASTMAVPNDQWPDNDPLATTPGPDENDAMQDADTNPPQAATGIPATGATATVVIQTVPSGATVTIDDEPHGLTPVVVPKLAPGRHLLTLSRPGYETLTRQIYNPGMLPERPYQLRLQPGVALVTSEPAGAAVVHGTQLVGNTPLLLQNLPPGTHDIRLLSSGYEPVQRSLEVNALGGTEVHVQFASPFGELQVVTVPPGCLVLVDGTAKGITRKNQEEDKSFSAPLAVPGLRAGEHVVTVKHDFGAQKEERVTVKAGEIRTVRTSLWIVDTKLTLNDGTVKYGMHLSTNEFGDVILAEPKVNRYLKEQIAQLEKLTPEQARTILERGPQSLLNSPAENNQLVTRTAVEPRYSPLRGNAGAINAMAAPATDAGAAVVQRHADQISTELRQMTTTMLARLYDGKAIVITGVPTQVRVNAVEATIQMGARIRLQMRRADYDQHAAWIKNAEENQTEVAIRGTASARVNLFIVRDCVILENG